MRGINKNVMVVKAEKGSRFEAVYFVLKKGSVGSKADILREANRIVGDSGMNRRIRRKREIALRLVLLIVGMISGTLLGSGMCILLLT